MAAATAPKVHLLSDKASPTSFGTRNLSISPVIHVAAVLTHCMSLTLQESFDREFHPASVQRGDEFLSCYSGREAQLIKNSVPGRQCEAWSICSSFGEGGAYMYTARSLGEEGGAAAIQRNLPS